MPPPDSSHTTREVIRAGAAATGRPEPDEIAVEEPLEIRVDGRAVAVTMRTPGSDSELAAGFLLTEGVISRAEDIIDVGPCDAPDPHATGNVVNVRLRHPGSADFDRLTRHVFSSSSCGLCGKATIESVQARHPPLTRNEGIRSVSIRILSELPERLAASQSTFRRTGGLHAAALFTRAGTLIAAREDVGRHNAVDKVLGWTLLHPSPAPDPMGLLVSGRISFEIVQKALAARIALIAGISAPTSLAVDFAKSSGQVLVGFLRTGRLNIYSHPDRLDQGQHSDPQ